MYLIIQEGSAQPKKVSPNTRHSKGFAKILQVFQPSYTACSQPQEATLQRSPEMYFPHFVLHRKALSLQEGSGKKKCTKEDVIKH